MAVEIAELVKWVSDAAEKAVVDKLGTTLTLQAACDAAMACRALTDATALHFADSVPPPEPLACDKGCAICCHSLVRVPPLDGLLLATHLGLTLDPPSMAAVRRTVGERRAPCPLLVDEVCSVYEARPQVCDAFYSFSVDACRKGGFCERYRPGHLASPTVRNRYHLRQVCIQAVGAGMARACDGLGLDGRETHIDALLRTLFMVPDAVERWLAGEQVFPDVQSDGNPPA